jgi:hypothetical protein
VYNLEQDIDIEIIRDGEPVEAFEAAKRIIGYLFPHDTELLTKLVEVAENKGEKLWARVASIYTLGFIDTDAVTESRLRVLLDDPDEPPEIRDYVFEVVDEHMHMCDGSCEVDQSCSH